MMEAQHVTKTYRGQKVLDDASLTVPAGRCVLLAGGNGSGKTTLLHLIVGLRRPDAGRVIWKQRDLTAASGRAWRRARRTWGFLPQHPALPPTATVEQLLRFNARLRRTLLASARQWLDRVGLAGTEHKRVEALSGGMRQRLGLALVLFFKPELIVLDEPASSLDPDWRAALAEWMGEQTRRGAAVLVTSQIQEQWGNTTEYWRCSGGRVIEAKDAPAASPYALSNIAIGTEVAA